MKLLKGLVSYKIRRIAGDTWMTDTEKEKAIKEIRKAEDYWKRGLITYDECIKHIAGL